MSDSKPTPGPWEMHTEGSTLSVSGTRPKALHLIADVYGPSFDEREANARLIASAPDLAARLARAEEIIRDLVHADGWAARHADEPHENIAARAVNAARAFLAEKE